MTKLRLRDRRNVKRKESHMSPKQEVARVGDWVEIHGHAQGEPPRRAMVLEVLGTPGNEHYRVRWGDDEHESIFYPGPDALIRHTEKPPGSGRPRARKRARTEDGPS